MLNRIDAKILTWFLWGLNLSLMANDNTLSHHNNFTLEAYESGIEAYVNGTPSAVTGAVKTWIDKTLSLVPTQARIMEIGSAFGRDAHYIESKGYLVERTDATRGFVDLLEKEGYSARLFSILTNPFTATYDLVFANAVFLQELHQVLDKIHCALSDGGYLSFSVKEGVGVEWTSVKVGNPRYFCYWQADALHSMLEAHGFTVLEIFSMENFIYIIAKKT